MKVLLLLLSAQVVGAGAVLASEDVCDFAGKFQQSVFQVVGKTKAEQLGSYGIRVIDRRTGAITCEEYVSPDQAIYPASTIKTVVAASILRLVDEGRLTLDEPITIDQAHALSECTPSGTCNVYGPGKKVQLKKLLWDMITVSNNLATCQLMDVASPDVGVRKFLNETAEAMGTSAVRVVRKVYGGSVNPEPNLLVRNSATARGFNEVYQEIALGTRGVLKEESRAYLIDLLKNQHYNDRLNAEFPANVVFYHKTGSTSTTSSDSGFYFLGQNHIVVLTGLQGFSGFAALRKIGKAAFDLSMRLEIPRVEE